VNTSFAWLRLKYSNLASGVAPACKGGRSEIASDNGLTKDRGVPCEVYNTQRRRRQWAGMPVL
jgi:hypothetical protein